MGVPLRYKLVKTAANDILNHGSIPSVNRAPLRIGRDWPKRFLALHPEYQLVKQKLIKEARKKAMDKGAITKFFDRYRRAVTQYKIKANRTYNMDETGMRLGVRRG